MNDIIEEQQHLPPIVLDMGKVGRKKVRELKKEGKGELLDDINEAIEQARAQLGPVMASQTLLPVVLVYEKKPRKKKKGLINLLSA
ncbi:DUF6200 domain-containing protein [Methylomagnum sp.]